MTARRTREEMVHPQFGVVVLNTWLMETKVQVPAGMIELPFDRDEKRPATWLSAATFEPCQYEPAVRGVTGFWTSHDHEMTAHVLNPEFVLTAAEFAVYAKIVIAAALSAQRREMLDTVMAALGAPHPHHFCGFGSVGNAT